MALKCDNCGQKFSRGYRILILKKMRLLCPQCGFAARNLAAMVVQGRDAMVEAGGLKGLLRKMAS